MISKLLISDQPLIKIQNTVKLLILDNTGRQKSFYKVKGGIQKVICGFIFIIIFIIFRCVGCILLELYTGSIYFRTHDDYE